MVRFGFPKHQKVYQSHKMVPCEFHTRPHLAPDSTQQNKTKKQNMAFHRTLPTSQKSKNVFQFLGGWRGAKAKWGRVQNSQGTIL